MTASHVDGEFPVPVAAEVGGTRAQDDTSRPAENGYQPGEHLQRPSPEISPKLGVDGHSPLQHRNKLEPRTITAADAASATLASILHPPTRRPLFTGTADTDKPVAYNPRLPHPAILYAAVGGKDVDLSEYFDENDVFVDIMYRRVGEGGRELLLQEGEAVTFPSVKDTSTSQEPASYHSGLRTDAATPGRGTHQPNPLAPMGNDDIVWKDDHVFGKSTTSGMTLSEATRQLALLRDIHTTAQQMVTGEEALLHQATHLINSVAALVHLTETVRLRHAVPSWGCSSVSECDSGYGGRDQKKRSKKTTRNGGDYSRQGYNGPMRVQPRHLGARSAAFPVSNGSTYSRSSNMSSAAQGVPALATYHSFGSPCNTSPTTYLYSHEQHQTYYTLPPDQFPSHGIAPAAGSMWHSPVSDSGKERSCNGEVNIVFCILAGLVFLCQWYRNLHLTSISSERSIASHVQVRYLPHLLDPW